MKRTYLTLFTDDSSRLLREAQGREAIGSEAEADCQEGGGAVEEGLVHVALVELNRHRRA